MKKYLSAMFLVTAITLTLSGCNNYQSKQFESKQFKKELEAANEQIAMNNDEDTTNDRPINEKDFSTYVKFDANYSNANGDLDDSVSELTTDRTVLKEPLSVSDTVTIRESLKDADAKLKEILKDGTLSQRLISSGNEMTDEEAEHIDNLTDSILKIISTYIEAIENGDKETCDKCNRALYEVYDLYNEIYDVVIGNKIPEGNEVYLVGDTDFENSILRGPYMPAFSNNFVLPTTNWLANMDKDIFDEYVVVASTSDNIAGNTSYIVDVNNYNDRLSKKLLAIKEDYSDIYGFKPEDVEIRWIGSEEEGSYGFIDKDTQEPYGLIDGLTNNVIETVMQDQLNLESRKIDVASYDSILRNEEAMEVRTTGI